MQVKSLRRLVRIDQQIRVNFPNEPDVLGEILHTLRQLGGNLVAHLVYEVQDQSVGLFVCEKPDEAALSLEAGGLEPDVEAVVVVQTENRWGVFSHLVKVLSEEGIRVRYSYTVSLTDALCIVFHTDHNEQAAKALEAYLVLPESTGDTAEAGDG